MEPENIPTSKPRSSAMRAEIASYTDAGWTQRRPEIIARKRSRRSVQCMSFRPRGVRLLLAFLGYHGVGKRIGASPPCFGATRAPPQNRTRSDFGYYRVSTGGQLESGFDGRGVERDREQPT